MLYTPPSMPPDQAMTLGFAQLGDLEEYQFDMDLLATPLQSPGSLTSSLLALSPISDDALDPTFLSDLDANPVSPPNPLPIKIEPLPLHCTSCGSSVVTPLPSTVALYSLAVDMAPATRSSQPVQQPTTTTTSTNPSAPAVQKPRGRKRKASDEDSAPDPASESSPTPAEPTANTKAKGKGRAAPAKAGVKRRGKAAPAIVETSTGPATAPADDLTEPMTPAQPAEMSDLDQPAALPIQPAAATAPSTNVSTLEAPTAHPPPTRAEVEALENQVRSLKKFKVMWIKSQQPQSSAGAASIGEGSSSSSAVHIPDDSVPRPPGERGKNGWNMQTALQLEDDGDTYNAILGATRDAVRQAGLDWRLKFEEQDPSRVGVCYSQMKSIFPYLKRFKGNWACRELVIGVLQNRRKSESAKIRGIVGKKVDRTAKRAGFKPRSKAADQDSNSGAATSSNNTSENQADDQTENQTEN